MIKHIIFTIIIALSIGSLIADEPSSILQGTDHFKFVYQVKLPTIRSQARLWIPVPRTDGFQTVRVLKSEIPGESRMVTDLNYGNEICVIDAKPADSGKTVMFDYDVVRKEKGSYFADRSETARFLTPEKLVPVSDMFKAIALETTKGATTDTERARALYDHVLSRMTYAKTGDKWGRGDAIYACNARSGNCTDFHAYFIALARSIGLPARFAIGATIPADHDNGLIEGYHCWAEVYVTDQWLPVDISEAWKHPNLVNYYFGHHPANRVELSTGRDLVVSPSPASGSINFLVFPLLECDDSVQRADTTFHFQRSAPKSG